MRSPAPTSRNLMRTSSTIALFATILSFALSSASSAADHRGMRPNVVYVLADDIGIGDLGHYQRDRTGKKEIVPTPNLDRLIEQGMRFDNAHSSTSLCSPTRYCVMSGNYAHRSYDEWGVWGSFNTSPLMDRRTVGSVMQDAGYVTAFLGKWHLGGDFLKKGSDEVYTQNVYGVDGQFDPAKPLAVTLSSLASTMPSPFQPGCRMCLTRPMKILSGIRLEKTPSSDT